jgi:hypothetical protein
MQGFLSLDSYYCYEYFYRSYSQGRGHVCGRCLEVGTVSQGKTIEVVVKNLKEASELYLGEFALEEEN